jgi:hypothetical protein
VNLNPFSAVSWSWRALRGNSVTFAGLFALGILGVSIIAEFRHLLGRFGAPWYILFLAPFFVVAFFVRKEAEWMPDVARRRRWARALFFGSILLALVIAKLGRMHRAMTTPPPAAATTLR